MPDQEVPKEEVRLIQNPLLGFSIRPPRNWHHFLCSWQSALKEEDQDRLEGLLHKGYNTMECTYGHHLPGEPKYTIDDVHKFYLSVADGWMDDHLCESASDTRNEVYLVGRDRNKNRIMHTSAQIRQALARKAYDMLCLNLFKLDLRDVDDNKFLYQWSRMFFEGDLFAHFRCFFRVELESGNTWSLVKIRNLKAPSDNQSQNQLQATEFLLNFCRFIWGWKEDDGWRYRSNEDELQEKEVQRRARIEEAKPWTIEVLNFLGKLDVIWDQALEFNPLCVEKLEEIALRTRFSVGGYIKRRKVANLEEALYAGSNAALLHFVHTSKSKIHARLVERSIFEREIKEASAKLEALKKES